MYDFKYNYAYQSGSTPDSKYQNKTILKAIFLFDDEVPKNQIAEVRERCRLSSRTKKISQGHYSIQEGPLDAFMKRTLHYQTALADLLRGKEYFGHREVVRITPFLWGLGFKLRSEASEQLDLNDMINLEAINEFVKTGKSSPRIEENLQKQA